MGVGDVDVEWSPWPSCGTAEAGPVTWVDGLTVFGKPSPSPPAPSIWWKFHRPTLRIQ